MSKAEVQTPISLVLRGLQVMDLLLSEGQRMNTNNQKRRRTSGVMAFQILSLDLFLQI